MALTLFLALFTALSQLNLLHSFVGRNNRRKALKQVQQQSEDEKAIAQYCEQILSDPNTTTLQILNLKSGLRVEEASIYVKPFDKSGETKTESKQQLQSLTPAVAIVQNRRMVVLGDAGAGKTTLLRSLAISSANGQHDKLPDLPILVSLSDFVRSRSTRLLDYTIEQVERHVGGRQAYLEERLTKGSVILLFDGLDEIQAADKADAEMIYRVVADQLNQLVKKYPRVPIVVTCRRAGWRGTLTNFKVFELVEFGWEDIQDFIRHWTISRRRPELFHQLATVLLQGVSIRSLAATPLLLALICLVFERRNALPQRRSELYTWFVEVLLTEAQQRNVGQSQLSIAYKQALLRKVALHFHQRGQRDFPHEDLLQVITPFLRQLKFTKKEIEAILVELVSEQGLLREQGEGLYGFAHISLQEFFAAQAIAENQQYDIIEGVLDQVWWHEVIILLAGLGDPDRVLRIILEGSWDRPNVLGLACRCLANQPPINEQEIVVAILAEAMQLVLDMTRPAHEKVEVVEALSQIKNPAVVTYFSQLFQMRANHLFLRWDLYARVILNLVQLGFAESYPVVFQLLSRPEIDADLKQKLIDAAIIVGEPAGALQDLRVILPLLSGDVRAKAILVLLQRGDSSLITPAIVLLRERQINTNLKRRLLGALSTGTILSPFEFLQQILPLLRKNALHETSLQLRALDLVVRRGGADAVSVLLERLAENPGRFAPEVSQRIVLMTGRLGATKAIRHLLRLLHDPLNQDNTPVEDNIRQQAVAAIAMLATSEYSLALRNWLKTAKIDRYSQIIAALTQSLDDHEDTKRITQPFLSHQKENRPEIEQQLRLITGEMRQWLSTSANPNENEDTDYFYGWPVGSY